ncbi:MAG: helix-turn-helix domain-containing protein [Candidatus Sigynarchaeota archaeon]
MRIERLRIAANFLEQVGFPEFFTRVLQVEITNTFQYDRNNFLSLARITFKTASRAEWNAILEQDLHVRFVHELSHAGSTLACIIRSTNAAGFFPLSIYQGGLWAIMPPITMDETSITLTLLAEEPALADIHAMISRLGSEVVVLALGDLERDMQKPSLLSPTFTPRQREIATYAVRHGFFEHPKRVTAQDIAVHFKISVSAVNEHLRKARQAAFSFFFS